MSMFVDQAHAKSVESNIKKTLSFGVISDLHAYGEIEKGVDSPSFLSIAASENEPNYHPISGLRELIKRKSLKTDMLISCGDMGDKAHPNALKYAWNAINEIGKSLGANTIYATSGNHDLDSRYNYNGFDAKGQLQGLIPLFPFANEEDNDKFWARHFVIKTEEKTRVVVLNSCAFHGTTENEHEHGRISSHTIERLRKALNATQHDGFNILVCHHHPEKHGDLSEKDADDYSAMKNGPSLVELLGSGEFGEWLIVHGHWHRPKLYYSQGYASSPIIFSAGSLCAHLRPSLQATCRNQFYIFDINIEDSLSLGLRGTFRAWDWIPAHGWVEAGDRSGLPREGGFGCRDSIGSIASGLTACVADRTAPFSLNWAELIELAPKLKYMLPNDLMTLTTRLETQHGFAVTKNGLQISELGRVK